MKVNKKQYKHIKIKNLNDFYLDRYHIRYSFLCFKFTIKNKKKIEFYKNKHKEKKLQEHAKFQVVLDKLNKNRKNTNPILTIILLTYNHVETIEKCIQSLLNQNTKYDYIIRICDDASYDGTTDICFEYAQKYPEKIEYVLQPFNTKGQHFVDNIKNINSKYWCFIDGDDWWTSDDKIETAIDFLENNPEYVIYVNDFIFKEKDKERSYTHEKANFPEGNNIISVENYSYFHPSSRIHRNIIDWNTEYLKMRKSDYYIYNISLLKGKCYFEDKIKSVWNYTSNGAWSSMSPEMHIYADLIQRFSINYFSNWKYDSIFSKREKIKYLKTLKLLFGKYLGWKFTIYLKKLECKNKEKKKINQKYQQLEETYKLKEI